VLIDNNFGKLGFYSLAVVYFTFGLFSIFSLPLVNYLGAKISLVLGSACYVFYVGSFIFPALRTEYPLSDSIFLDRTFIQVTIMITAIIIGFGAAILWVA
jgi:Ion channel regulatory protein UNC-93